MRRRRRRKTWESRFRRPDRSGRLQHRLELGRSARPADHAAISRAAGRMAPQPSCSLACRRRAQVSLARGRAAGAPADDCRIEGGLPKRRALTNPRKVKDQRWPTQMSPSASALQPTISYPGSVEAKDALQTFSAPFGEINRQLASLGDRYVPGLQRRSSGSPIATRSTRPKALQQSFAADAAAPRRRCASGRRRGLRRRGTGRATRASEEIEDRCGRFEAETRPLFRGGALLRNHAAAKTLPVAAGARRQNTLPNSRRCKGRMLSASNRLRQNSVSTT